MCVIEIAEMSSDNDILLHDQKSISFMYFL